MTNAENCTIQDIAINYKNKLVGKVACFEVKDPRTPILIKFPEGGLAHLLGLHYFNLKRGEKLFDYLINGEITWEELERRNKGNFEQFELRMRYMIYLPEVIEHGKIVNFKGNMKAELMVYHPVEKRYLFLGIIKEKTTEYYTPTTFIENKRNKYGKAKHLVVTSRSLI
ncbi:PBECR4 domain-containing protein [Bacillaceae bacterium S4-13-58]